MGGSSLTEDGVLGLIPGRHFECLCREMSVVAADEKMAECVGSAFLVGRVHYLVRGVAGGTSCHSRCKQTEGGGASRGRRPRLPAVRPPLTNHPPPVLWFLFIHIRCIHICNFDFS